jgi:hypothetical protein
VQFNAGGSRHGTLRLDQLHIEGGDIGGENRREELGG